MDPNLPGGNATLPPAFLGLCPAPPETSLDYLSKHTSAAKSNLLEIDLGDNDPEYDVVKKHPYVAIFHFPQICVSCEILKQVCDGCFFR